MFNKKIQGAREPNMKDYQLWDLFIHSAAIHLNDCALIADDRTLTYSELKEEVYFYANSLKQMNVQAGDKVAILLPRDSQLIVAILSVLAIGATYIPLDLRNPNDRNKAIMDDSACKYLISKQDDINNIVAIKPPIGNKLDLFDSPSINKNDLAYIIYTSGSTGKPKGAMISHENACSMIHWAQEVYSKSDLSYTLAATSICFDLSIFEIFLPLSMGGCIVLVEHALSLLDGDHLPAITLINTVPSAISALNKANAIPSSVKVINLAGEALQQLIVNELYENTNVERIYNLYGPSETTTYSTYCLVEADSSRAMAPIGLAITGTNIYLLDQNQSPVPRLARGEIYIGGAGVCLGYMNRLEETKNAFITLMINGQPMRVYRTGDLAKFNHKGHLEYLGRKDHQIKIRGFRVEPGEITHILKQYPEIKDAYVMTHPQVMQGEALLAYIVANEASMSPEVLKSWLMTKLPDYMIPQYFSYLEALPLNANGKIDRAALILPQPENNASAELKSDLAERLSTIWKEILNVEIIHLEENFFYIGGHSLLAARLKNKIHEVFSVNIKLEEIFSHASLAEQANLIQSRIGTSHEKNQPVFVKNRPDNIPLSYSQQRLWYLHYAEEKMPISNIPLMIKIQGNLNISALKNSFISLIDRHEILRTTYESSNYQIYQKINSHYVFDLPVIECDETNLELLLSEEANKLFNLKSDLMLRAVVFKTQYQTILMVTQHHIASDAWSLNVLMKELSAYYLAYNQSLPLPVLSPVMQYADYSCWQISYLTEGVVNKEMAYWKDKLVSPMEAVKLPYDYPIPEENSYKGEFFHLEIPKETANKLTMLASQHEASLFMVLLAAFNILLYRYTNQKDLLIGILSANRSSSALDNTLGFFVNTLAAKCVIQPDNTFLELLSYTKDEVFACLSHQQLPFDKLVDELRPSVSGGRHPFFQVLFSLQNALTNDLELDGLIVKAEDYDRKISKFDLTLSMVERKSGLSAIFEFNTDLFKCDTIQRMATHYLTLLSNLAYFLRKPISTLPILTEQENQHFIVTMNKEDQHFPADSIGHCFAKTAQNFPNNLALIAEEDSYTYAELDKKSSKLANLLIEYGVKNANVGLLLPRGVNVIVSMLAIIKAGGAYVNLDPSWPTERLDYIIHDAGINLVISAETYADNLPSNSQAHLMLLEELDEYLEYQSEEIDISAQANDLCYIMYTSGSTGKPKGVMAQHAGVVRLVKNTNYVRLDEHETLLQISQLVFDGSTFDIWGSLLNGGTLVLTPPGLPELANLAYLIKKHNVTTIFITTQLFNTLVDLKLYELSSLKQVLFGGNVASIFHVKKFKSAYPDCHLSNIYGPTECTTFALSYLIPDEINENNSLPLGQPISHTSAVILSEDRQIVPIGVPGEICLGGPGLAIGYINQENLTKEKFINNPISELNVDRLYLTGDIGMYTADGHISFIGRRDDQVKLRGYRIELLEIEQVIRTLDIIKDVVVLIQQPEDLLIAYVIQEAASNLDANDIKQMLAKKLPAYMQPDIIKMMQEYPLTTNGKIDKRQLPKCDFKLSKKPLNISMIDGSIARTISQIWLDVLDYQEIEPNDNFFEVGGNSLKIVHVLDKLQTVYQGNPTMLSKLNIAALFQYPTIMDLANYLEADLVTPLSEVNARVNRSNQRAKRKQATE